MLTTLAKVKRRLGLPDSDLQYDTLLTDWIAAVTAGFERYCGRGLVREVDHEQRYEAHRMFVPLDLYPVEGATLAFELRSRGSISGALLASVPYGMSPAGSVVELDVPLGVQGQQVAMKYTGGYVPSGAVVGPGQYGMPADLENAATETVATWFMLKDRSGLSSWSSAGFVGGKIVGGPLLASVEAVLKGYVAVAL
jgi:hypothetical protein